MKTLLNSILELICGITVVIPTLIILYIVGYLLFV